MKDKLFLFTTVFSIILASFTISFIYINAQSGGVYGLYAVVPYGINVGSSQPPPPNAIEAVGGNIVVSNGDIRASNGLLQAAGLDIGQQIVLDDIKFSSSNISYYETDNQSSGTESTTENWTCICGGGGSGQGETVVPGQSNLADNTKQKLISLFKDVFSIKEAVAVQPCYDTPENCFGAGCTFCQNYYNPGPCTSGEKYACTGCDAAVTAIAAACDTANGWYEVGNVEAWCYRSYIKSQVFCEREISGGATPDWHTKIKFEVDTSTAYPNRTIIKDNLSVPNNYWGSGVNTGCEYVNGTECPQGKFVAGTNFSDTLYCCDL